MLPATNADISRASRDRRMCMAVLPFERLRRRLFHPGRITNGISSAHEVIATIDVKRLAGDEARGVVQIAHSLMLTRRRAQLLANRKNWGGLARIEILDAAGSAIMTQ